MPIRSIDVSTYVLHLAAGRKQCCFAAGFGNHKYDTDAYAEAGCPKNRIFLIDEDSRIIVPVLSIPFAQIKVAKGSIIAASIRPICPQLN